MSNSAIAKTDDTETALKTSKHIFDKPDPVIPFDGMDMPFDKINSNFGTFKKVPALNIFFTFQQCKRPCVILVGHASRCSRPPYLYDSRHKR